MNKLSRGVVIMAAVFLIGGFAMTTQAFHDGGVATCTRCHSMHSPVDVTTGKLLVNVDQSSTCLDCHQNANDTGPGSYHVSSTQTQIDTIGLGAPLHRSPGGDFGWLRVDYTWTSRGTANTELGETHGHNIVAGFYGYVADSTTNAPGGGAGGGFPSSSLGCQSCHDPHGKAKIDSTNTVSTVGVTIDSGSYDDSPAATDLVDNETVGVYRLLRAASDNSQDGVTFDNAPVAVAPHTYNRTEANSQTRVAYGYGATGTNGFEGWAEWCGTCHEDMHSGSGAYTHRTDENLGGGVAGIYNSYVMTGQMNGTSADSYSSLVPFATNQNDRDLLKVLAANPTNDNGTPGDNTDDFQEPNLAGPIFNDKVTCLSCHRAHASGFKYALRWFQDSEFITEAGDYYATNGRTVEQMQASYYDRPATVFATYQRSLCNKCHAQD